MGDKVGDEVAFGDAGAVMLSYDRVSLSGAYRLAAIHIDEKHVHERWELVKTDGQTQADVAQQNWRRVGADGQVQCLSVTVDDDMIEGDLLKMRWDRFTDMKNTNYAIKQPNDATARDDNGDNGEATTGSRGRGFLELGV
jgi:predicted DNA-binding WGR domain protein